MEQNEIRVKPQKGFWLENYFWGVQSSERLRFGEEVKQAKARALRPGPNLWLIEHQSKARDIQGLKAHGSNELFSKLSQG